jgi:membrane fusion protein (multidrug efflux system)
MQQNDNFKGDKLFNYILIAVLFSSTLFAKNLILTGTVISNNKKMIPARYMGYVKKVNFVIGDKIKREDTLFELESAEFDMLRSMADLSLEQAKLTVDIYKDKAFTSKKNDRQFSMMGEKLDMNMSNFDDASDNISASVEAAQTLTKQTAIQAKQFANIIGYLKVKAPSDGILVQRNIQVGDMVAPGMLTMIIVDMDHLEIEAEVAESNLKYVFRNQNVDVVIPSFDFKTTGYIKAVVPSANPMSHTFKIRVHFKMDQERIFPGMYAKIYINLDK